MKNIDVKSLLIGVLLTSTIFLGVASTGPKDKWDFNSSWQYIDSKTLEEAEMLKEEIYQVVMDPKTGKTWTHKCWETVIRDGTGGWEPFAIVGETVFFRRRIL